MSLQMLMFMSLLLQCLAMILPLSEPADVGLFNWTSIIPANDLEYHSCYNTFKCARLLLPLDWQNLDNDNRVTIAIITLPAKVPSMDSSFGGTIITNPGGPGVSGVDFLLRGGEFLQATIDSSKHFEILSFDPRGVQHTTPSASCFQDSISRRAWEIQTNAFGNILSSESATKSKLAAAHAIGGLCKDPALGGFENGDNIRTFSSTASVARDMFAIVDKLALISSKEVIMEASVAPMQKPFITHLDRDISRLQYYGGSYGTHLGNTFVSMFPERTGHMVLDGVIDSHVYLSNDLTQSIQDSQAVIDYFYHGCFQAEYNCALYRPSDQGGLDIQERVHALFKQINDAPIPIIDQKLVTILTSSDMSDLYFSPWYSPITLFRNLATTLNDLMDGNYTSMISQLPSMTEGNSCNNGSGLEDQPYDEATPMIWCGEGKDISTEGLQDLQKAANSLLQMSPWTGALWAGRRAECMGWKFRQNWTYEGPFGSPEPGSKDGPSAPLLFISSQYDPVTPLTSARAMSALHPKSAVAYHDSYGHTALFSAPSKCMAQIVKAYFAEGVVPRNGTRCSSACDPWHECPEFRKA